jgi:assimilatory nitrate reductase catalytic subunit
MTAIRDRATATVATTCPYCGVGCGVDVTPSAAGEPRIAGTLSHPANFGRLCVKGSALGETVSLDGRLLHPMIHGQRATWNQAVGFIADGLQRTINRYGPDSVALYLSGQLLTEDYYIANKFAKGFLGTGHVDTNSRLCMASSVAGHRRAFGSDTVPQTYEDLDTADLIVLVGSNAAWCHPILYQRMQKALETRGTRIVNIDPRRTATSEGADLQLSVRPGMDSVLFSHLLVEIANRGAANGAYLATHTEGFDAAIARAREIAPDLATTAARTGLDPADIATFVHLFITTQRTVTCYSQGVNQSAQGTDKVNAILNCHLATGRIGKPGCGPLSLTGQPNAMGGREVGGLANMLAAHMGYSPAEIDRVRRFWNAPRMATGEGLKAVQMFDATASGRIKALWVMHTNPAVTLPRADAMRRALAKLDLFVVSEALTQTDTTLAGAHVLLPASAWGEKDGTVTNSERRISRQRAFLPPPGECKPDWKHVALVARRMGFTGFDYAGPADIWREHAALTAFENNGARDFDLGAMADVTDTAYATMQPFLWPWRAGEPAPRERFFADGGFFTPNRRGRLIAIADPALATTVDDRYPLVLNTGRVRDHWHTMTRTGKSARLARHVAEPYVQVNPNDATRFGLVDGGLARIDSPHGSATLRVAIDIGLPSGMAFAPFHWSDATGGLVRVDSVVEGTTDPVSGQPEAKATPVAITPIRIASEGFIVTRQRLTLPSWLQHVRIRVPEGEAITFGSHHDPERLFGLLANLLGARSNRRHLADPAEGRYRSVTFAAVPAIAPAIEQPGVTEQPGERLETALFIAPTRELNALDWIAEALALPSLDAGMRKALLAGRAPAGGQNAGPVICSCFGVREATIRDAITAGASDVDAVGACLKAGTNCGSCRPEIARLIRANASTPIAAE